MALEGKELAMQIIRENYRGSLGRVFEKDGEIHVEGPAHVGSNLPVDVRGFPIRFIEKAPPGRAATAASSSTSTSAKSRLEQARADNERLRQERASQQLSPDEQHELDELEAENARLRG